MVGCLLAFLWFKRFFTVFLTKEKQNIQMAAIYIKAYDLGVINFIGQKLLYIDID